MNKKNARKTWVWVIALCLIFTTGGISSAASVNDIQGHWAEGFIMDWANRGLVVGYEDGTFRPDNKVSREEFTALVNRSFEFEEVGSIQFTDVTETEWSYLDISIGVEAEFVSGYPDGTFQPKKEMSRQEVAVIIQNILGLKSTESAASYTDGNSIPEWSMGAISSVKDEAIMIGYMDGSFRPLESTTRAEAIVILDRALQVKAEQSNEPADEPIEEPTDEPTEEPTEEPTDEPAVGTTVNLGVAGDYVILAKTGISSVPASVVNGDIGVSPIDSTGITGFSLTMDTTNEFSMSNQIIGKAYASDYTSPTSSNLTTAISNMETAFTDAAGRAADYTELHSGDISGQTLEAGVYKWGTAVLINSDVTLDGGPNDVWIFQIAGGITQASDTKIILAGGAQAKNIFWQAAETVSIGTNSHFEGIILGQTNITMGTNASINGRLLAQTAVTLDQSTIVAP